MNTFKELVIEAAYVAGEAILEVYNINDFNVELKGDSSPLTLADKKSHQAIVAKLQKKVKGKS